MPVNTMVKPTQIYCATFPFQPLQQAISARPTFRSMKLAMANARSVVASACLALTLALAAIACIPVTSVLAAEDGCVAKQLAPVPQEQTPSGDSARLRVPRFTLEAVEMAAPLRIVCYHPEKARAEAAMEKARQRIHELNDVFSDYDANSEVSRLSQSAGTGQCVHVSEDLWRLLVLSVQVSQASDGAFDITVGPLSRLWRRARMLKEMPPQWRFEEARRAVGYHLIKLDPAKRCVQLLQPKMRLDLGAVAKGYAIDEALNTMRGCGVATALVDLGGDIGLGDTPPDRPTWKVAVAELEPDEPPQFFVQGANCGLATSGDRSRFVILDGKRYSHIVDPRTGVGLNEQSEVTVVAPSAALADALATAVCILGAEKGLPWIDSMPNTAALYLRLVDSETQVLTSRRWKELTGQAGTPAASASGQKGGSGE